MSTAPETPSTPPTPHKGQFKFGNAGGPGNPFARQVAELRKELLEAVSLEKLRNLVDALIERAKNGDVAAAKLVLQYALGKPAAAVDPDRIEIEDYKLRTESALPAHVWGPMLERAQVKNVNQIAEIIEPILQMRVFEPWEQLVNDEILGGGSPKKMSRKERKEMRRRRRENAPSPNGSNGASANSPLEGNGKAPRGPSGTSRAV